MSRLARLSLAALLLAATLAAAGCASAPPPEATGELPSDYPNHSLSNIRQALARGTDTLDAFQAKARLSIDTPELSQSASARIRARRGATGDSLHMTLSKLGFTGARILVTPDSFFVYNALENELTYGALTDAGGALPAPLRSGRTFESLLGLVTPRSDLDWQVRPSTQAEAPNRYVLTSEAGRSRHRLVVDPSRWRPLHYTRHSGERTLLEERRFSQFGRFDGHFLPRRVELRQPPAESAASIYYEEITLNPDGGLPPFDLDVPKGAERTLVAR